MKFILENTTNSEKTFVLFDIGNVGVKNFDQKGGALSFESDTDFISFLQKVLQKPCRFTGLLVTPSDIEMVKQKNFLVCGIRNRMEGANQVFELPDNLTEEQKQNIAAGAYKEEEPESDRRRKISIGGWIIEEFNEPVLPILVDSFDTCLDVDSFWEIKLAAKQKVELEICNFEYCWKNNDHFRNIGRMCCSGSYYLYF